MTKTATETTTQQPQQQPRAKSQTQLLAEAVQAVQKACDEHALEVKAATERLAAIKAQTVDTMALSHAVQVAIQPAERERAIAKLESAVLSNARATLTASSDRAPFEKTLNEAKEKANTLSAELSQARERFKGSLIQDLEAAEKEAARAFQDASNAITQAASLYLTIASTLHLAKTPIGTMMSGGYSSRTPLGACELIFQGVECAVNQREFGDLLSSQRKHISETICCGMPPTLDMHGCVM